MLDRARRINPEEMAIILVPAPLMELHPSNPSGATGGEVEEEEEEERKEREEPKDEEKEGDHEEFVTGFTQESKGFVVKNGYAGGDPSEQACARLDGRRRPGYLLLGRDCHLP